MKGYKVFNPNWTCHGFQYVVGKTYEMDREIVLCARGFHFCELLTDCFHYYPFDFRNKVAEVEALGDVIKSKEDSKCVTNKLKIVKELSWLDVLQLSNIGRNNIGFKNIGDCNIGANNAGNYNIGEGNTGWYNYGNFNSGIGNIGNFNSGSYNIGSGNAGSLNYGCNNANYFNIGNYNTGIGNHGNYNIGDFNITDYSAGVFCTQPNTASYTGKIKFFDKDTNITLNEWRSSQACRVLCRVYNYAWKELCPEFKEAISAIALREIDKKHDEIKHQNSTNDGLTVESDAFKSAALEFCYKQLTNHKVLFNGWWRELPDEDKEIIKSIPNFDPEKFEMITGIHVE